VKRIIVTAAMLLVLVGCRDQSSGSYVQLTGRIFVFNYRVATATYVVTYEKLQPVPDGAVMLTEFDDPAGGEVIEVKQKVWPKIDKIAVSSPPIFCIVKDKPYTFKSTLFDPNGARLQEISGTVISSLDQTVLPDRPLVVGPGYTPNPELKGNPSGELPGQETINCKK
jgi:hypothetical protein